ncbi:uncharacterized protein LOC62_02G002935 [Vanrija pseudolonga]|uniref:Uncharacterized protein n=1 Tax=Vanrija pseudolonga TaxID=143232 RepID=A0AAF0Y327_9TREE|nr:hypothetical protein LOC62_02G002935 [Vanrija pseudolonga]
MLKVCMKDLIAKELAIHGAQHQTGQEVVLRSISTKPIEFTANSVRRWHGDHIRPNELRVHLTSEDIVVTHTLSLTTRSTCCAVKRYLERFCGYDYDKIE